MGIPCVRTEKFVQIVWRHYRRHGRDLPWRPPSPRFAGLRKGKAALDPYKILVSEIMLQQTQVSRVLKKYPEFIRAFPDIQTLAHVPLRRVLQVWQGMGYNRRAKALRELARTLVGRFRARIPQDQKILESLPGVGPATAGAVMAYAWNKPAVFIETNIRRVFIHHFFPRRKNVYDEEILKLVAATVSKTNPREWYWALMDYGTHLAATVPNPNRRSKHYAKQTRFEGSERQLRGRLLKFFAERHSAKTSDLRRAFPKEPRLAYILRELVVEGFLCVRGGGFGLR